MGTSSGPRRARGALERDVLTCLAVADRPLTATDVLQQLGGSLAYTTVLTALSRLHQKGVLRREAAGRAYAYRVVADEDSARAVTTAHKMRRMLEAGPDRAGVLAHFVADLGPEDEQLLASLLRAGDAPTDAGAADAEPTD